MNFRHRFLLIGSNEYEIDLLANLASALLEESVDYAVVRNNDFIGNNFEEFLRANNINVVFSINLLRNNFSESKVRVRWISWIQDKNENTENISSDRLTKDDIIYLIAHPRILNIKMSNICKQSFLFTGVSEKTLNSFDKNTLGLEEKYDVSIVGFIASNIGEMIQKKISRKLRRYNFLSNPLNLIKLIFFSIILLIGSLKSLLINRFIGRVLLSGRLKKYINEFHINIEESIIKYFYEPLIFGAYTPFNGEVADNEYKKKLSIILADFKSSNLVKTYIDWLAFNYPRSVERATLARECIRSGFKLAIYGKGWDEYPQFFSRWHGVLRGEDALNEAYRSSKVNLHCNPNGFGMHSRVLQSMGAGGFIMTHKSKLEGIEGTISSEFTENVHFRYFSGNTLIKDLRNAILDEKMRQTCIKNAYKVISENHTWKARARQILLDLN